MHLPQQMGVQKGVCVQILALSLSSLEPEDTRRVGPEVQTEQKECFLSSHFHDDEIEKYVKSFGFYS